VANGYALGTAILPQNFTFVAVSKRIGTNNITFGGTDFYPSLIIAPTLVAFGNNRCFGSVGGYSNSTANLGTGWTVVAAAWSGATHQNPFYANGGSQTFGSVISYGNATGLSRIGKTGPLFGNCEIADMLLWQRALTSQELLDVSANLNATWGGVY
jgi:hypothetical protein